MSAIDIKDTGTYQSVETYMLKKALQRLETSFFSRFEKNKQAKVSLAELPKKEG